MRSQLSMYQAAMLLFAGININNVCDGKIGFLMGRLLRGEINLSKLGVLRNKKMAVIGIYYGETSQYYYASQAKADIGAVLSDEGYIVDIPICDADGVPIKTATGHLLTVANGDGFITFVKDGDGFVYARLINIPREKINSDSILDAFEAWTSGKEDRPEEVASIIH